MSVEKMQTRPYQADLVSRVRASIGAGHKRVLMVMPTGGGKTHCASDIMAHAVKKGRRVLFLANRRKLVQQCAAKLEREGIPYGIIMAGERMGWSEPVLVASIQTIASRFMRKAEDKQEGLFKPVLPPADIIIADEAHVSLSGDYKKLRAEYPNAILIGLTATPCLGNGRGLGAVYEDMVFGPSIGELTELGVLVPVEYYGPSAPDLKGVKISKETGDYDEDMLAQVMDQKSLIGDIVQNWQRICPDRQTVVFAASVAHSRHIVGEFRAAGITAEHIDAETNDEERRRIFAGIRDESIQVVSNYGVLVEGWDEPQISCAILAQPTRNPGRYLQMAGRVLRGHTMSGKANAIIIDHSGNVERHGFVDEDFGWSLDQDQTIQERQAAKRDADIAAKKEKKEIVCQQCFFVFSRARACPKCGWALKGKAAKPVPIVDAELVRLQRKAAKDRAATRKSSPAEQLAFYAELLGYARNRNKNAKWVAWRFKDKFGFWPNFPGAVPVEPTRDVLNHIRHCAIRYARSLERA